MIWDNLITTHHRWMANFLRRQGWVAFYLEPQARRCDTDCCWLRLYESQETETRSIR